MTQSDIIPFLLAKGFSAQYRGFTNLAELLSYSTEHPDQIHSITGMYQSVAQLHETNAACIEHNIRYLLEAWHIAAGKENQPRLSNKIVIRTLTLELLEKYYHNE